MSERRPYQITFQGEFTEAEVVEFRTLLKVVYVLDLLDEGDRLRERVKIETDEWTRRMNADQ